MDITKFATKQDTDRHVVTDRYRLCAVTVQH